jgi:hypothetical protein
MAIGLGALLCAAGAAGASQRASDSSLHLGDISVHSHSSHSRTHAHDRAKHRQHSTAQRRSSHAAKSAEAQRPESEHSTPAHEASASTKSASSESATGGSTSTTSPSTESTTKSSAAHKSTAHKKAEKPARADTAPRPTKEHKSPTTTDSPTQQGQNDGLLGTVGVLRTVTKPVTDVTSSLLSPKKQDPSEPGRDNGTFFPPPSNEDNDSTGSQQNGGDYSTQEITDPAQVARMQRPSNAPRVEHRATKSDGTASYKKFEPTRARPAKAPETVATHQNPVEQVSTLTVLTSQNAAPVHPDDRASAPHHDSDAPTQPEPLPAPSTPTVGPAHTGFGNDRTPLAILPQQAFLPLNATMIALHSSPAHAESALLGLPNTAPD